jgi:outer membrane receptor protein involved in Fe transport
MEDSHLTTQTMRTRLMASSMISGVAVAAVSMTGAQAQTAAPAAPSGTTSVQELVVTGSRIPSKNLTSVSPVTTVNSQDVKLQGTTNTEDLINNLPQAFADFGQYESNGASGTATIDLRGIGNKRTLVLIDGKRIQPGDPIVAVPDINFIPPTLIDRVEVLTGGASAVYGSDAVAGVVNFILKKNYEGLQIDSTWSIGEHNNNSAQTRAANINGHNLVGFPLLNLPSGAVWTGQRFTTTITGGSNSADGKGNVEFYLAYTHIDPVLLGKYDWGSCGLTTNTSSAGQFCAGSSNDAPGRLDPQKLIVTNPVTGITTTSPGPNFPHSYTILPGAAASTGLLPRRTGADDYNFAPLNYLQRPDTRYNAGEFSHYEIAPWLDTYSSFMFMNDTSVAQIAPSGSFTGDRQFTVPCNDPLLTSAEVNTLCGAQAGNANAQATFNLGKRNVEGSPRSSSLEHTDYRFVIGAKGDLGSGWTYDVSAQYGRTSFSDIEGGYLSYTKEQNALDVVPGPGGVPTCASVINGTDKSCVPWNLWTPGGVTPAALKYLTAEGAFGGYVTDQVVTGAVTGDLGQYGAKSPWASDGVGISVGAEYQRDFLSTNVDAALQSGDLAGRGGTLLETEGSQTAKSIFGELRVPIVQDMPYFKELTLETGYRWTNYAHGGGNSTYKVGGDWQIVPDIRLRASYERAVRAPNVNELFTPQSANLVGGTDICAGPSPTYTAAQCYNTRGNANQGLSLAQFTSTVYGNIPQCISGQCGTTIGGNPNLKPEEATTYSFGGVFTPTFFRGFSLSVDYFNITVNQGITVLPLNLILTNCATTASPVTCALINRDANDNFALFGGLGAGGVIQTEVNASSIKTSGVDINATYHTSFSDLHLGDWGGLTFNFTGTYVHDLSTTFPGETYDCAGLFGITCGTPTPKWRHQMRVTWNSPWNLTLSAAWRFIDSSTLDINNSQPALKGSTFDLSPTDQRIPDFSYFDVSFEYKFHDRYTIRGGINNIFDRTPPLLDTNNFGISAPPFGNGNTYPQVYDPLGRVFFVGLTADF